MLVYRCLTSTVRFTLGQSGSLTLEGLMLEMHLLMRDFGPLLTEFSLEDGPSRLEADPC